THSAARRLRSLGFLGVAAGMILLVLSAAADQAFIVIVHPDTPVLSLTDDEASDLFLKKNSTWKVDGSRAQPVTLSEREVTEAFVTAVHHRSSLAIRKFWQRQVFTGRGTPPPELGSVEEMLRFVSSNRGAIGYVPAGTDLSRWKVRPVEITAGS
ncbi:MAG: hypothetical protein KDD47_25745, partial [Acidobacteria bacterium]|nr:hypothetical protein [Acidobacteriota bacterium]